ncbi:MAG: hypothetical protein WB992_23700, partial [Bryobacteraceae bacterium]
RRFADAEKILVGLDQNTAVLPELAVCILLEGDKRRANAAAEKFAGVLSPDAKKVYLAQWMALSGHPDQAVGEAPPGYSLFLNGHYSEAAEVWRTVVHRSGGTDLPGRAMLAASLDRAGKTDEARKILVEPFIPPLGDLYAAIAFNEMRRMLKVL